MTAALKSTEPSHRASLAWLTAALAEGEPVRAPAILLPEVTGAIRRATGSSQLAGAAAEWLAGLDGLELVAIDRRLAERSAELCRDFALKGCDAVYVALADRYGATLLTLDTEQLEKASAVVAATKPASVD